MKKRKTTKKVPSFVDIEADEDTSSDLQSDNQESEDIDGVSSTVIEHRPERDWNKFTEDLAKKYIKEGEEEYDEEISEESEVVQETKRIPQYLLLPNSSSPRLWIIRVARGKEKEICFRVFNNLTDDASIFSIVAKPDLFGYIYIESYTKQAVLDSLVNIRFVNRTKISAVPLNEMVDVMTIKCVEDIVIGNFVRVKKGKYKDDVGQVIKMVNSEMVRIRIVPRIDNIKKKFDETCVDERMVQVKNVDSKKVCIYKKEMYVNGFLEKDVMINSLYFNIDVSFDEAKVFEKKKKFNIDEKIRVKRGDFINMFGVIKNIERNEIEMDVDGEIYRINMDDVEKGYLIGDEISYKERSGVIVKKEGDNVTFIYTDTYGEEGVADIDEIEPPITQKKFEVVKNIHMIKTKRDPYLNQSVQILKGNFKGYFGVVKDVYKESCRILLDCNLKYVNVDREYLVLKESYSHTSIQESTGIDYSQNNNIMYNNSKTPHYKNDTGKIPNIRKDQGKTPSYKYKHGETPNNNEQNKTPHYSNNQGKTPQHRNEYGKTPQHRNDYGKTPNYKTPYNRYKNDEAQNNINENNKTPNFKNIHGKTPNYISDFGKTPNNLNECGKTPSYSNDYGRTPVCNMEDYDINLNDVSNNLTMNENNNITTIQDKNQTNVFVTVNGEERILKEIKDNKYILDDNKEYSKVDWVYPDIYDKVRVMEGNDEGYMGILIGIDNGLGMVRNNNGDVKNIKINFLTRSEHGKY